MNKYELTIIASGVDTDADGFEERFFEAGCSDATLSLQKGVLIIEFNRQAKSFVHALVSAISDVRQAGAHVERIEPDHLVSLSDIAKRAGMSRAAVSLYSKGQRSHDFPFPVARVTTENPLWDWVAVSRWMFHQKKTDRETVVRAKTVREANIAVVARTVEHSALRKHLEDHASAIEAELAPAC